MESDFDVNIILLGESDVGKTSLIERFVENKFKDSPVKRSIHKYEKVTEIKGNLIKLIFWDTTGREAYYNFIKSYYHVADGALFIYDVQNAKTFFAASKWLKDFKETNKNAELLIAGNKAEDKRERSVTLTDVKENVETENLDCIEVSAKENKNANIMFYHLVQKILVAKGILPYSNDSLLTEVENSEAYPSDRPVKRQTASFSDSPEQLTTANISSEVNTCYTNCMESNEPQLASITIYTKNTPESFVSYKEATEQNTSNIRNAPNTTASFASYAESTEQHTSDTNNASSTKQSFVNYIESTEQNTSNRVNAPNTTKSFVCYAESTEQHTSDRINAPSAKPYFVSYAESTDQHILSTINAVSTKESMMQCAYRTEQKHSSSINMPGTKELLVTRTKSTERNLNAMEPALNVKTNASLLKNEVNESHDDEDSSLNDYGFQFISMDDLRPDLNQDSRLVYYAKNAEQEKQKGKEKKKGFFHPFSRKKEEKNDLQKNG